MDFSVIWVCFLKRQLHHHSQKNKTMCWKRRTINFLFISSFVCYKSLVKVSLYLSISITHKNIKRIALKEKLGHPTRCCSAEFYNQIGMAFYKKCCFILLNFLEFLLNSKKNFIKCSQIVMHLTPHVVVHNQQSVNEYLIMLMSEV